MKNILLSLSAFVFLLLSPLARSQDGGVPVKLTVTAEPEHDKNVPTIEQNTVTAYQDKKEVTVSRWVPARGQNAALELFLLIDDASATELGTQLSDIKKFIQAQPATTLIGVAYMQNGIARVLQDLSSQHDLATKALRLPMGIITAGESPYLSLSDLIKRWPASQARREVLMITSGVDPLGGPPPIDAYLETAISDAQRAGILVYSIYTPHSGHFGRSFWRMNWGENYLSELAEATGADSFWLGFGPAVSFAPFLAELSQRLENQYRATVLMNPGSKAGFEPVRVITKTPDAEVVTQTRAYVPLGG